MRQLQPVIWSKGVALSPQHLQAQDRFFEASLQFQLEALAFRGWGFTELQVDGTALSDGLFSISRAAAIFPDGLLVEMPSSDPLPPSRVLDDCFRDGRSRCTFYLAVPQSRQDGLNIGLQRAGVSTRYSSELLMLRDESNGQSERPVSLARKNLHILAQGESLEGSVTLPLGVVEKTEAGTFRLDAKSIAPMLNVKSSEYLNGLLRGLLQLLVTRSDQLAGARRQKNQSLAEFGSSDIANFWLLYTINTHLPAFQGYFEAAQLHPEVLFSEMAALAGSLTTFSTSIQPRDLPRYDHEHQGQSFSELDASLRELLETVVPTNFVALPLKPLRDSIHATSIDKDSYFENSRFYLAVSADMRSADLIARVPQLAKVGSSNNVEHLVRQALPGLRLVHVPAPPKVIPVKLNYQYFSIECSGTAWESVTRGRNLAVYLPGEIPNPVMELLILLPAAE
jgi:type VI secretion system protein ImpJ